MCKNKTLVIFFFFKGVEEREMFASVSESMMVKFGFDESISVHTSSQVSVYLVKLISNGIYIIRNIIFNVFI